MGLSKLLEVTWVVGPTVQRMWQRGDWKPAAHYTVTGYLIPGFSDRTEERKHGEEGEST